jgi:hypothetical protein
MRLMLRNSFLKVCFFVSSVSLAQTDMEALLNEQASQEVKKTPNYVHATFKGTKLINGHSVEAPSAGVLQFIIYHRFSNMNDVIYNFFGLDGATTRIGLDYGLSKRLSIGIGRTAVLKAVDGYVKYKLLMQSPEGAPITMAFVAGSSYNTIRAPYYEDDNIRRLNYLSQLLLARKFNASFSLQLMPTYVYNNLAETDKDQNGILAQGYGARLKISKRTSINWEHYVLLPNQVNSTVRNTVALGFDIDTGGHIFQFHFTNASSMIEQQFIPLTTGNIAKSEFRLGFNISRVFTVNKKAASK